jgi:hypothetical protein
MHSPLVSTAARFRWLDDARRALFLVALRASQAAHDILKAGIPAGEVSQRVWVAPSYMFTGALQINQVLSKLIGQPIYLEVTHDAGTVHSSSGPAVPK